MLQWISAFVVTGLLAFSVLLCLWDLRRRRVAAPVRPLSFLIPCYNDGETLRHTIASIQSAARGYPYEILVADDASTDDSAAILAALEQTHGIRVHRNPQNLGKALTLNALAEHARHEVIVFMDADTMLRREALQDMLARLAADDKLAAVSCPYQPLNRGWLARMQAIEYSMMSIVQGAYNRFSAMALWGGCIAVRKDVFEAVGRFSPAAITEDVDLAYKLNAAGWRVEQSMVRVQSQVPHRLRGWIRQKTRWTAGGFQCLANYPHVWLRNPVHVVLVVAYSFLSVCCCFEIARQLLALDRVVETVDVLNGFLPFPQALSVVADLYGGGFVRSLLIGLGFSLLSVVYIIPLISRAQDLALLAFIVPFSLAYFPLYAIVSLIGLAYLATEWRRLAREERAW